jgi:hypothetical protein
MRKLNALVRLFATIFATAVVYAHVNGPPPGYTGAPGEGTCSDAGCHDVPSSRYGLLRVSSHGQQHTDTVVYRLLLVDAAPGSHVQDWGFQITILDSLDQPFGQILVLDSVRTKLTTGTGGKTYLSHTAAGVPGGSSNYIVREILWVRPPDAAITDPIYFYASGLLADGDGTRINDAVETSLAVGPFCDVELTGDVNWNFSISSADVIWMVGYVFKGGDEPLPCTPSGDVNCDLSITSADIVYLVNYAFKSGPPPCDVCPLIIDGSWTCY